jgi:DNA invertase Pin-like site-specific DNA recombinase
MTRVTNLRELSTWVESETSAGRTVQFADIQFAPNSLELDWLRKLAEWDRHERLARQREGIRRGKMAGNYSGGNKLDDDAVNFAIRLLSDGMPKRKIAKRLRVSHETLYKELRKRAEELLTIDV